jgi:hypothetical protein
MPVVTSRNTEAAIWTRIVHPDGKLTASAARAILKLSLPDQDRERMHALAAKARAGSLTPDEEFEIDNYERVGHLLSILKSKARKTLKQARRNT